jgi:hypothetical protein
MKRWILAIAVLFVATVALHADYVVIRVNLAVRKDRGPEALTPVLQVQPQQRPRAGGGMYQQQPGGQGPQLGQGLQLGQGQGVGGPGAGARPGQGQGLPGGQPGIPFGQGSGVPGGGRRSGGKGEAGGGGPGEPGEPIGRRAGDDDVDSTPIEAYAIIEMKSNEFKRKINNQGGYYNVTHPWGKAKVPWPIFDPHFRVDLYEMPTVAEAYAEKWKKIKEEDPDRKDKLLELARWAIEHGISDTAAKSEQGAKPDAAAKTEQSAKVDALAGIMDELAKLDAKNPAVIAFKKVEAEMNRPIKGEPPTPSWGTGLLRDFKRIDGKHYSLYSDLPDELRDADAQRRLDRLEKNYTSFYHWFALQGVALPVPKQRLVAVLVSDPGAFERWRRDVFDSASAVDEGFYSRGDNVAILSATRLDYAYVALKTVTSRLLANRSWSPQVLLAGKGSKQPDFELYRAQTLALVQKFMEDEAERATIAYEGTRQLLAAIDFVPRTVELPQWADFGVASFFTTPKESFWSGVGTTGSAYFRKYKTWEQTLNNASPSGEALEKNSAEALKAVVTDRNFRLIKDSPHKEKATAKARTMAWALTLFLAEKKLDDLRRYFDELRNVPRDLELDEDALLTVFARAFNLQSDNNTIDESRLASLAEAWYTYMRQTPINPPIKEEKSPEAPRRGTNTMRREEDSSR